MWNRRQVLKALPAVAITPSGVRLRADRSHYVWIGSCADASNSNGIYGAQFDPLTGKLSAPSLRVRTPRPSYFDILPGETPVLYAVNELSHGNGAVAAFAISAGNRLSPLNEVPSQGDGPCYLSLCARTRTIYTANFHGSSVSVFPILPLENGALGPAIQYLDFKNTRYGRPGPDNRQVTPHPHSVTWSPDRRFLIVNDLGNDSIDVFSVSPSDGSLSSQGPVRCQRPPASGPRHIAFHPRHPWAYGISELNSTLQQYKWIEQANSAKLEPLGPEISTLADASSNAGNAAAEVVIAADGRFLYASNRGDDSLTVFSIDAHSGLLHFRQRIPSGGKTPRHFLIDPSQAWLLCCNNGSDAVTVFARDARDGSLDGPRSTVAIECPKFCLYA
jgi:6-phosphogluconolactonase